MYNSIIPFRSSFSSHITSVIKNLIPSNQKSCLVTSCTCFVYFYLGNFQIAPDATIIRKGIHSDIESYSAFWDYAKTIETPLRRYLKVRNITDVYVCGIAIDVCIGEYMKQKFQINLFVV